MPKKLIKPVKKKLLLASRRVQPLKINSDVADIVGRFNAAFEDIAKRYVIGRTTEIEAIKLALLTKKHVMLDGPPGTCKSLLAKCAFRTIRDGDDEKVVTFFRPLLPGTIPEEVFGPINPKLFREEGVIRFNTKGMFPSAHFVFLDEVYRGPDSILNSLLVGLNERVFVDGPVAHKMPLMTCIGTTNFVADTTILEAFRDRWMFTVYVEPSQTAAMRISILKAHLRGEDYRCKSPITLDELRELHELIQVQDLPDDLLALYEEFVSTFRRQGLGANLYISDRRYAEGVRALQTGMLLSMNRDAAHYDEVMANVLPIFKIGNDLRAVEASLATTFERVVGDFVNSRKEVPEVEEIETITSSLLRKYDPHHPKLKLRQMSVDVTELIETLDQTGVTNQGLKTRLDRARTQLCELRRSLCSDLGEDPSELKTSSSDAEINTIIDAMAQSKNSL